jgi:trehalose/maltose hydrolase-like predicted phosphorylase
MSDINTLQVQVAYLSVLKREPTTDEISTYSALLSAGTLTLATLKTTLESTTEYLKLIGLHCADTSFSNYTLYCSNISESNYSGVTIANGKICLISSSIPHKMQSLISTNFDLDNLSTYSQNTTETFDYTYLQLFDRSQSNISFSNIKQSLNTLTANFSTSYSILNSNNRIDVTSDVRALRNLPYCAMQTVTLLPFSNVDVDIYHHINTPTNIQDVRYNNNIINASVNGTNKSIYFFQANGLIKEKEKNITCCCAYSFDSNVSYKGYNINQLDTNNAFNKFTLELSSNVEYRFDIISSTMTQLDFPKPDIETQRSLINALTNTPDEIIATHASEWVKLWESSIVVNPKSGITDAESEEINTFNKFIKLSLYNIYSCIRDDINVNVNPLNLSSIDLTGHIFWNGELWLLPVLTFLKPYAVRSLLDFRYSQLESAIKLAASQGYKGSKFAYQNDSIGYTNVYWNSIAPLQIFNTALISISVWNYFRVTRDYDWLQKKGFEILKNNADFFVSLLVYNETLDSYSINNVYSIDGEFGDNNSLTNYLAKVALNYATQAKYELDYTYNVDWDSYVDKIKLNVIENPGNSLYNLIYTNNDNTPSTMDLLEPLLIMFPYYSKHFFTIQNDVNGLFNYDIYTLKDNLTYYISRLNSDMSNNALNKLLIAFLKAEIAQLETIDTSGTDNRAIAIDEFNTYIKEFFSNCINQPWNGFYNSYTTKTPSFNDIGISSMFILGLLTTLISLSIEGKLNDTRDYLHDIGIESNPSYILPKSWKSIEAYIGNATKDHYCILNQLLYP